MNNVKIIDVYGGNPFNPGQIKMDGYIGVIFKFGQGGWADCPRYHPTWWAEAKAAGLLVGWYWLCDSRHHSAEHLDEMVKFGVLEDVGELGCWIDVEKPRISMTETEYYNTPFAGAQNLVDLCYLLMLRGIKPGIYTGPGAYELVTRYASSSAHNYLSQFDLWTAQYPNNYIDGVSKPSLYGHWTDWTLWQWREGPDVNIFNGTDAEFYQHFAASPVIPPTGETSMFQGTVLITELNIRPQANTTQPAIGKLKYNDKIEASAVQSGWWKLSKIVRGGVVVPLPAADCYAYEGSTQGYIKTDSATPPPVDPPASGDVSVNVNIAAGVTTVTVNGTAYHA